MLSIGHIQIFILALTRILMANSRIPVLGGEMIPTQVRLGLGVLLTLAIAPWQNLAKGNAAATVGAGLPEPLGLYPFAICLGRELLIGALIGFAAGLAFDAAQIAGEVMGLESGFGSDRVFNPVVGASSPAFAQLFNLAAILIFLMIDGHAHFILALAHTFEAIPLQAPLPLESLDIAISQVSRLIMAGVQMGMPMLASLFLADLALGLLSRVAPHIQVYFLGLPFKIALTFFGLGVVFTVLIPPLENLFRDIGPRILALGL